MYECDYCRREIMPGEYRLERYKLVFCNLNCLMSYVARIVPQFYGHRKEAPSLPD